MRYPFFMVHGLNSNCFSIYFSLIFFWEGSFFVYSFLLLFPKVLDIARILVIIPSASEILQGEEGIRLIDGVIRRGYNHFQI